MRIAYVLDKFPSRHQTFVTDELLALEALGHEIMVGTFAAGDGVPPSTAGGESEPAASSARATRAGLSVVRLPRSPAAAVTGLVLGWLARPSAMTPVALAAARSGPRGIAAAGRGAAFARRSPAPDHVHAHFAAGANVGAWAAATLWSAPFSFTAHAVDIFARPVALCESARAAAFVATVSEHNRRAIGQICRSHGAPTLHLVRAGIVPEDFAPGADGPDFPREGVLSVGRLIPKKGHATLVRAAAVLAGRGTPVPVTIVGDGPDRAGLEELASELGVRELVRLAGALDRPGVRAALKASAVFALPCTVGPDGDRDGIPVALMEAMASEVPVVTTSLSGIPELVSGPEHGGLIVPADDPDALASAIAELMSNAQRRRTMGTAARARVAELFDVRRQTAVLAELMAMAARPTAAETKL